MRVALVCAHYAPAVGGVESHVEEIAKRLVARGDSVEVLTHHDEPGYPDFEIRDAVTVRRHRAVTSHNFGFSSAVWYSLIQNRQRYDVVHVHGYHSAAPLTGALAGVSPMVFTPHYHGTGHSLFRKVLHIPYRLVGVGIVARSRRIICVSQAEARLFLSHFPRAKDRVCVIPNGADIDRIAAARPFPGAGKVIVTGGRLESYKQVDRIVRAMVMTPGDMSLIVTGDGPERPRLEKLAAELGVGDRVTFIGRVDTETLYRWYATAGVFCSMSTNEAMPVTILELLGAGARVVASDIPAHRDIRERTRGAIALVSPDAGPELIAGALTNIYDDPIPADQAIPTWDDVTEATARVYREVIRKAAT